MQMSGIVVLLVAIIASRLINERGFRVLDPEAKLRLIDGFSATRVYSLVPLLFLIVAYWYLMTQTSINRQILHVAYFGLLIVFVVARSIWNQAKLTQLNMPAGYQRMFTVSQVISLLGLAWFFFAFFQGM